MTQREFGKTGGRLSRRNFLSTAMTISASMFGCVAFGAAETAAEKLPARGEWLIRNAAIISVDPVIGTLARGDIHVRNGMIVTVAPNVSAPGAKVIDGSGMVAMPGFVDTHWHMWEALARTFKSDQRGFSEEAEITLKHAIAPNYTPDDSYNSISLAMAEVIHAGVTGVLNYADNMRSPAHADAEIRAHIDSGVRTLFCYGQRDAQPKLDTIDLQDIERVRRQWFPTRNSHGDLVDLGIAFRGPGNSTPDVFAREIAFRDQHGLKSSMHTGVSQAAYVSVADMKKQGYLNAGMILAHNLFAQDADRQAMADTGASLTFSTLTDFGFPTDVRSQILATKTAGVNISLSVDSTTSSPVNMFESMRMMLQNGEPMKGTPSEAYSGLTCADVLRMATLNGARACGWDKITGSITPGKRADILLIRATDINIMPLMEVEAGIVRFATPDNIDTVFIDGRIMKRGGKVVGIDEARIKRDAITSASRLWNMTKG